MEHRTLTELLATLGAAEPNRSHRKLESGDSLIHRSQHDDSAKNGLYILGTASTVTLGLPGGQLEDCISLTHCNWPA